MMKGYYIHNQKKDDSGVSKKIDAQIKVLSKNFDMHEVIIGNKKENYLFRKVRMKILKKRPTPEYGKCLEQVIDADFAYIRKQILDDAFYLFLCEIKKKNPKCRIMMEVPTYPYWNEFPNNELGRKMIEKEKIIIPKLKGVVDTVVGVGTDKALFGIKTLRINNGVDIDSISLIKKQAATPEINLIAVAKWRDVHGYERVLESLIRYYQTGGNRKIKIHMVGDGPETEHYKCIVENEYIRDKVFFYGVKSGQSLDDIYDVADIGLGVFAFHRTGGMRVSTLKGAEYLAKGLPVVTAVEEDCLQGDGQLLSQVFPDDDSPIDMREIISFYDKIYEGKNLKDVHKMIRDYACRTVSMDKMMESVVGELLLHEKDY